MFNSRGEEQFLLPLEEGLSIEFAIVVYFDTLRCVYTDGSNNEIVVGTFSFYSLISCSIKLYTQR